MSRRHEHGRAAVRPPPLGVFRAVVPGQPRHGRWRPATCQFIAGEPEPGDAGKCGRPVAPGSSFCPAHHALCWYPAPG